MKVKASAGQKTHKQSKKEDDKTGRKYLHILHKGLISSIYKNLLKIPGGKMLKILRGK